MSELSNQQRAWVEEFRDQGTRERWGIAGPFQGDTFVVSRDPRRPLRLFPDGHTEEFDWTPPPPPSPPEGG